MVGSNIALLMRVLKCWATAPASRDRDRDSSKRLHKWGILALAVTLQPAIAQGQAPTARPPRLDSVLDYARLQSKFERQDRPALEKRQYISGMKILARLFEGQDAGNKLQMMTRSGRRYLFQYVGDRGRVIDVSNPLKPVVANDNAWSKGKQIQLAYHRRSGRWLLITSHQLYDIGRPGFRGVAIHDASDPMNVRLLSEWSLDGGSPSRKVQAGSGTHRNYYDGGDYLYLTGAKDNNYYTEPTDAAPFFTGYQMGIQVVDISDPARPKEVSYLHYKGQRIDEEEDRQAGPTAGDPFAYKQFHGPMYVPERLEQGGRYGYASGGAHGVLIFDLADRTAPKLAGEWRPTPYVPGPSIATHTVDVTRLNRGFVISSPEEIFSGCVTARHGIHIIDVTDRANPKKIGEIPPPVPPKEAGYRSFCDRAGRFSAHNAPHLKAPGRPDPNFTCYSFFNAGLQCYDLSDPRAVKNVAYFIPEQGGEHLGVGILAESARTVDNVFIEWDRRLIWVATDTGIYLLSADRLGTPVLKSQPVREWSLPSINQGAPVG